MQQLRPLVIVTQLVFNTWTNQINNQVSLVGRKEEMGRSRPNAGRGVEGQTRPKHLT